MLKCIILLIPYFTIYLFFYIIKIEFTKVKIFRWLCGKKIAKREAGANHRFMSPVNVFRWYIDQLQLSSEVGEVSTWP